MCHPAPGPRCSAHAYVEYIHAQQAYEQSGDAMEALKRAGVLAQKQALYDSTPRGQRALDRARQRETDFGKILELQKRLEDGLQLRQNQLAAYHAVIDTKRSIVKSQLLEEGVTGRYQHAAGIAFDYLSKHRHDLLVSIKSQDTIEVEVDGVAYKVFVLPQKYQHAWGAAKQVAGRYTFAAGETMERLLNVEGAAEHLSQEGQQTLVNWFANTLRAHGYAFFAGVNTLTEQVHLGIIDEIVGFIDVGLRLQTKPRGTSLYRGDLQPVRQTLMGTVFEQGTLTRVLASGGTVVTGVPQQARKDCTVGQFFLAWQDAQDRFEVRLRHVSSTVDVIVKARHKRVDFNDAVTTQAVAILGGALV